MPCLKILTNLQKDQIPKVFVSKILLVLSKCVNKPVEVNNDLSPLLHQPVISIICICGTQILFQKFIVTVSADCTLSINGNASSPAIVASLESIGNLGPAENKIIAKDITHFIEKELGVNKD